MRRRAGLVRRNLRMSPTHFALAPAAGANFDPIGFDIGLRGWRDFGVSDNIFGLLTEFAATFGAIGLSHRHIHRRRAIGFFRRRGSVVEWPLTRFTSGTFRILLPLVFAEGGGWSRILSFEFLNLGAQLRILCLQLLILGNQLPNQF